MLERALKSTIILLLLVSMATAASANNTLNVIFERTNAPGYLVYNISVSVVSDFIAYTCELTTPTGTYEFVDIGYVDHMFSPDQDFYDDCGNLSFSELMDELAGGWTLIIDKGLSSQVVVTIDFGTVLESNFPLVPTITAPVNGVPIQIPGDPNPPTIEWTYGTTLPCVAQYGAVEVIGYRPYVPSPGFMVSGNLSCHTLSWTPPSPLSEGTWAFAVINSRPNYRQIDEGINIVEGSWVIQNEDWLALRSSGFTLTDVVPTGSMSWGAIKALYLK